MTLTLTTDDAADFLNVIVVKIAHQCLLEGAKAVVVTEGDLPERECNTQKAPKFGIK